MSLHTVKPEDCRVVTARVRPVFTDFIKFCAEYTALSGDEWDEIHLRHKETGSLLYVAGKKAVDEYRRKHNI